MSTIATQKHSLAKWRTQDVPRANWQHGHGGASESGQGWVGLERSVLAATVVVAGGYERIGGVIMFALNERLSEYAYGFGATTEALSLLRSVGTQAVPFLPNLIHENEVGFDVSFSAPGTMVMLQFKLGHQLGRFVRKPATQTPPDVARPFWRFEVNVDHQQFIRLRSWETLGAEVYYVAPRFSDWLSYERHFLGGAILDHSLLITPQDIHSGAGGSPGKHRIVYDRMSGFVCSEASQTPKRRIGDVVQKIRERSVSGPSLGEVISRMKEQAADGPQRRATRDIVSAREAMAGRLRARARSAIEGEAAVFAAEAWSEGVQVMFVGEAPPPPTDV